MQQEREGAFVWDLPLWFIVMQPDDSTVDTVEYFLKHGLQGPVLNKPGAKCFAVFTDEDLAERFCEELGAKNSQPVKVESNTEFASLVDYLVACEFTDLIFDPSKQAAREGHFSLRGFADEIRKRKN